MIFHGSSAKTKAPRRAEFSHSDKETYPRGREICNHFEHFVLLGIVRPYTCERVPRTLLKYTVTYWSNMLCFLDWNPEFQQWSYSHLYWLFGQWCICWRHRRWLEQFHHTCLDKFSNQCIPTCLPMADSTEIRYKEVLGRSWKNWW